MTRDVLYTWRRIFHLDRISRYFRIICWFWFSAYTYRNAQFFMKGLWEWTGSKDVKKRWRTLKTEGRGSIDHRVVTKSGVIAVQWFDNLCVELISNCTGIHPIKEMRHFDKKHKEMITTPCPQVVTEYNILMGGLDLFGFTNVSVQISNQVSAIVLINFLPYHINLCVQFLVALRETLLTFELCNHQAGQFPS